MGSESEDPLDRWLQEAYPTVEVSPDFTLRLWRRLMKPARPPWWLPAPVFVTAAAIGLVWGTWSWTHEIETEEEFRVETVLSQTYRWDLFGNAPFDSMAGSYLSLIREG